MSTENWQRRRKWIEELQRRQSSERSANTENNARSFITYAWVNLCYLKVPGQAFCSDELLWIHPVKWIRCQQWAWHKSFNAYILIEKNKMLYLKCVLTLNSESNGRKDLPRAVAFQQLRRMNWASSQERNSSPTATQRALGWERQPAFLL